MPDLGSPHLMPLHVVLTYVTQNKKKTTVNIQT